MKKAYELINRYLIATPSNIPMEEFRYFGLLRTVAFLGFNCHLVWLFFFLYLKIYPLFIFNIFSVIIFWIALYLNKKRKYFLVAYLASIEVISHQVLGTYLLGTQSGFQYFLFLSAMIPFLLPKGRRRVKVFLMLLNAITFLLLVKMFSDDLPLYEVNQLILNIFANLNILIVFFFLGVFALYLSKAIHKGEKLLSEEREKSDQLLYNILPISIANQLKEDNEIIAKGYESVSVMFADLVNFTDLSSKCSPEQLVKYLNKIFCSFDRLTDHYGLEKIKTIGDAYMVSGGLPFDDVQHLKKMALLSLEMMTEMQKFRIKEGIDLRLRIGFHCGPVVAGVIGVKKFAYDLWGDTVNIASRMESHGLSDQIHVSAEVYQKLKESFVFEQREVMQIKGKGEMQTYILLNKKN